MVLPGPGSGAEASASDGPIHFAVVDAFATKPFRGNPAAVVVLEQWKSATWLQEVAAEFNLSETAFLVRRRTAGEAASASSRSLTALYSPAEGLPMDPVSPMESVSGSQSNEFDLRWFTPTVEVELCGHATLAAAHVVFAARLVSGDTVLFHTLSGVLTCTQTFENSVQKIELDLPGAQPYEDARADPKKVSAALGSMDILPVVRGGTDFVLVELPSEEAVRSFAPDFEKMRQIECLGVIVTAKAKEGGAVDFVSRMFAPRVGINEDPVTGAAHCVLTPYWSAKLGKTSLRAHQASKRGGHLEVRLDAAAGRVYLKGQAVVVMGGTLLAQAAA